MSAGGNGLTDATFAFFSGLAANNDSAWFNEHRETFTQHVEDPFISMLEDVTARLAGTDLPLSGSASTMFRINRDVRFSKDKSPYSTHRSGLLTPGGTKAEAGGLVYVHLDATGGYLAGGLYRPQTAQLQPLREAMVEDPDRFAGVLAALDRAGYSLDRSDPVKTMPRGYTEHSDHPRADDLRLKQLVVTDPLPRATWLDDTVAGRVADFALAVAPLIGYVKLASDA